MSLATNRERVARGERPDTGAAEKVRDLAFNGPALEQAVAAHEEALAASQAAETRARQAEVGAAGEPAKQDAAAMRLGDAIEQHAKLAELESEARHLARASDLLADFRNTVVAAVGPRLAVQAAELFAELTDHEYDQLQVDPETYQLQITDAGRVYGLDRFSGSEIDLANLALRVAISEHVHLQSGGSIGLLVLDEVFGPLDEDRKARMLLALERLRGRFRQIIVVTHDASIKEQLPNAIEVIKLPGRRATAQLDGRLTTGRGGGPGPGHPHIRAPHPAARTSRRPAPRTRSPAPAPPLAGAPDPGAPFPPGSLDARPPGPELMPSHQFHIISVVFTRTMIAKSFPVGAHDRVPPTLPPIRICA